MVKKPHILYRVSMNGEILYLRVPDDDTEKDSVLTFNRLMADLGFPNPKDIFNERLGVAVVPTKIRIRNGGILKRINILDEVSNIFTIVSITDQEWYTKRF